MSGGIHPSIGAATAAVKNALLTRFQAALAAAGETEVDCRIGFMWPSEWFDQIAITATSTASDGETVTLQRRQHKTVQQDVSITVFRPTSEQDVTMDRAYHLLDILDKAMREEPTLDGAALWCFSDDLSSDGVTLPEDAGDGRVEEIVITYAARVLITRP